MALIIEALDHLVSNVDDVLVSVEWYQRALGMQREDVEPGREQPARVVVAATRMAT